MTAAQILLSFRAASQHYKLPSISWLQILVIASHGPKGCPAMTISRGPTRGTQRVTRQTFLRWEKKGLITRAYRRLSDCPRSRPQMWVTITPAACDLLKITLLP